MGVVFSIPFFILTIMCAWLGATSIAEVVPWFKQSDSDEKIYIYIMLALSICLIVVAVICCWIGVVTIWLL